MVGKTSPFLKSHRRFRLHDYRIFTPWSFAYYNELRGGAMARFKVYISDYDYPDVSIEKEVLEPIDADVIGLQCKTGEGLAELAADADAILQQYAKIPRGTIEKLANCKAICRYGIGVDIVDVDAAYEHGIVCNKRTGLRPR